MDRNLAREYIEGKRKLSYALLRKLSRYFYRITTYALPNAKFISVTARNAVSCSLRIKQNTIARPQ
jgi:hypothetical protein